MKVPPFGFKVWLSEAKDGALFQDNTIDPHDQ
jgi:hypothetical protein